MATITNHSGNPSFEVDVSTNMATSGGVGRTRDTTTTPVHGSASLQYNPATTGHMLFFRNAPTGTIPVSTGDEIGIRFSWLTTGTAGEWKLTREEFDSGGSALTTADVATGLVPGASWAELDYTTTVTEATAAYAAFRLEVTTSGSSATINVDAVVIANLTTDSLAEVPAYFDGDSTDAAWVGTSGVSKSTLTVTSNTAPTVDAGADTTITAGDTLTRTVSFTDPDADTWSATADYGEGAGAVAATVDQGNKTVALSNEYETAGEYTVTVVVDDGTTTGQDTFTLTVNNAPTSGYYTVIDVAGTDVGASIITLD